VFINEKGREFINEFKLDLFLLCALKKIKYVLVLIK